MSHEPARIQCPPPIRVQDYVHGEITVPVGAGKGDGLNPLDVLPADSAAFLAVCRGLAAMQVARPGSGVVVIDPQGELFQQRASAPDHPHRP